ncbi:hypothetical protein [Neisseria dentiae]|uniref:hypothetical protein n=1 Tax=Neisseria dentiae TaxID=194197 RepID=UPI00211BF21E|nr:hypothetical protein [Neisseria dentiae]MCQ9327373.1 hypothetical protein [Neisseria dentiae]
MKKLTIFRLLGYFSGALIYFLFIKDADINFNKFVAFLILVCLGAYIGGKLYKVCADKNTS